ncbi:helix-turn-helix domain-containing protein [Bradyrhizobium monzae]|uniref:helix-turn-helix domain-containing protein n=1 Tax=Bradyrhizobium sp. Oc8 TaxID=2876780 RepID=UPI00320B418D
MTPATRLGISSRHLAPLFERHVGATPQQLAKTLRVRRAKRLLDAGEHTSAEGLIAQKKPGLRSSP